MMPGESSRREDNRRVSNGDQVTRVVALAMKRGKSVDFTGYRHGTLPTDRLSELVGVPGASGGHLRAAFSLKSK